MGSIAAENLVEISDDPSVLNDGNFWAITTTFEGTFTFARFSTVGINNQSFSQEWTPLEGRWTSSMSREKYCNYVEEIKNDIAAGAVYQVNACRVLTMDFIDQNLAGLYQVILKSNPAPYSCYLSLPDIEIASASPELFLHRTGDFIQSSPIKGTQKLHEKGFGLKDQTENVMIVDLMRNDFGRICREGSIDVPHLLRSEDHPGLRHLVSDITGKLRPGIEWNEIFSALLPAGSISGAPKYSALSTIGRFEKSRGPYCGILGWIHGDKAILSVAIRIFWKTKDSSLNFGTGAGITWNSDPLGEWEETELKAARLISLAGGVLP